METPYPVSPNIGGDHAVSGTATLIVVCAVQYLTPFMMSAVGVALPSIGTHYFADALQLGLIETVFILAVSLFLLPTGRLGDIFGRKKLFILGILFFLASTGLAAFSATIELFIVSRFLQGTGAAMITGTSLAILSSVFPPEKRGKAMGLVVASIYLGVSTGPALGGFLIVQSGWQAIFYFGILVGTLALVMTLLMLRGEWSTAVGERFDWFGSVIYVTALLLLITGVVYQASGIEYRVMAGAGIVSVALFLKHQYSHSNPLLDINLILSSRVFAFSNLATLINYAASFGVTFFFSLYLQTFKGINPQSAGLILMIQPALQVMLAPLVGLLSETIQPAKLSTSGMLVCSIGLGLAVAIDAEASIWLIALILGILGMGFALFATPNMLTVMSSLAPRYNGVASSLVSTMRTLGMLASMTLVTALLSHYMKGHTIGPDSGELFVAAMQLSFVIFTGLGVAGTFLSMARQAK